MVAHALPTAAAPLNPSPAPSPAPSASPTRLFGRFELRQLLGKSAGTMAWLAFDPGAGAEVMLTMPRVQPADPDSLEHWLRDTRFAARLSHPRLAPAAEVGVQDHWPFIAVERTLGVTLKEWVAAHPNPTPEEVVGWICHLLQGLAFAHEAGVPHLDLQLHNVLIDERGQVRVMALAAAGDQARAERDAAAARSNERSMAMGTDELRAQRAAATRDVLACGLLLHQLLTSQAPLDEPDIALALERLAPQGRELIRLPWSTPLPIPEALRAIANRCTSGQERLRYQNARTLLGALTGWLEAQAQDGGGPVTLLVDRLRTVGHLPALPGLAARVARVTNFEGLRTDEVADHVLDDTALAFELLRTLNSAQVQGTQVQGNGPVLTLRRAISLIGVNGVRLAANTLRPWPGPLNETQAAALQLTLDRVRLAGYTAQALRPAGYDAQVVYLITVLQNLGRLMLRYHFADEAEQIQQLMKPNPPNKEAGTPEQPGLSEEAAAYAVLGVDIDSLSTAVQRQWGLGEEVMHMARRLPPDAPVHRGDSDAEVLRMTASAANEAVDVVHAQSGPRLASAITAVVQRYARALNIGSRDVAEALQAGRDALRKGSTPPAPSRHAARPADPAAAPPAASTAVPPDASPAVSPAVSPVESPAPAPATPTRGEPRPGLR
ncbi:MAG TPA: HDOD domain-containing protein [Burkholderiaceae bacterium]|jgi:non-specific serine/threonine protein kinase